MDTTIQVRADSRKKKAVQQILDRLGLDLSTAINMYLVQIIEKQGIPFQIVTENGFTPTEEHAMLQEIDQARANGKRYPSAKALHKAILKK